MHNTDRVGGCVPLRLGVLALAILELGGTARAQQTAEPWPTAVLAPSGYTAAVNSPTADVLPWGTAALGLSNSNPERKRRQPAGSFGSLNAGVSPLPGLELVGRLAYEGDLNCNAFQSGCKASQRDLSLSGKYQLPLELPLDTRLALGFNDYGGGTSQYRQLYGVATSTVGPLDLSLGYGKPKAATAMLDGAFGSVALRLDERWSAALEHDSRAARLGLAWRQPLTRDLSLQLGASRKLAGDAPQQTWQLNAGLNLALGWVPDPALAARPATAAQAQPSASSSGWQAGAMAPAQPAIVPPTVASPAPAASALAAPASQPSAPVAAEISIHPVTPEQLAQSLVRQGFSQVQVQYWPAQSGQPALWQVRAESRRWRQSQIDALGAALAAWLRPVGATATDELLLTLTWQREPVLHAYTSAACLQGWLQGSARCNAGGSTALAQRALWVQRDRAALASLPARRDAIEAGLPPVAVAEADGVPHWMPQFEIGPGLRTAVGTELGLIDYSLALELGTEVNLAPGLFWQGVLSAPVLQSDDFRTGQPLAGYRARDLGFDSSLLSYWKALPNGASAQASAGYVDRNYRGGMVEGLWMTEDGRWRLGGTAGRFEHELTAARQTPLLGSARWSLVPGAWQLEATAGRFLGGDHGYSLASRHWFGDTELQLFYRDSQGEAGTPTAAQRKFIGFSLSLPLGPKAAADLGPVTLRGSDRFAWGLQTKIGDKDNALTSGYGEQPRARHGLRSDVTDYDRNGRDDLWVNNPRLRAALEQQLGQRE